MCEFFLVQKYFPQYFIFRNTQLYQRHDGSFVRFERFKIKTEYVGNSNKHHADQFMKEISDLNFKLLKLINGGYSVLMALKLL